MSLRSHARALRTSSTDAESRLWYFLRCRRTLGLKFRRQHPVGRYIVDFVCFEPRIVIEVDGGQHQSECVKYDQRRDRWLTSQGFVVLRFWNAEVLHQTVPVLERIAQVVAGVREGARGQMRQSVGCAIVSIRLRRIR